MGKPKPKFAELEGYVVACESILAYLKRSDLLGTPALIPDAVYSAVAGETTACGHASGELVSSANTVPTTVYCRACTRQRQAVERMREWCAEVVDDYTTHTLGAHRVVLLDIASSIRSLPIEEDK